MAVKQLDFWFSLLKLAAKSAFALKTAFFGRIVFMCLNNLILLVGWWAVFQSFNHINGWAFSDFMFMSGLVIAALSLFTLFFRGAGIHLARLIEFGELDPYLIQPRNPLFHICCSVSDASGLGDLISGCLLMFFSGLITPGNLGVIILMFLAAALLFLSMSILFSSIPFYARDASDLSERLFFIFFNIAGYPGCIYSGLAKFILIFIFPAGVMSILPIEMIHTPSFGKIITILSISVGFFGLAIFSFYQGLKRYESSNHIRSKRS